MMRAARADRAVYREVEADLDATSQAVTVVILAAVASGIGTALGNVLGRTGGNPVVGLIGGVLQSLIGWAVFSFVMYLVGTRVFSASTTYGRILRSLGFAYAPGVLNILGFIPVLGALVRLIVGVWILVTSYVALREGLGLDNGRTIATIVIGIICYLVVGAILAALFAALGLGIGLLG